MTTETRPLNRAQRYALETICGRYTHSGATQTSRNTGSSWVSGRCANALLRMGLVTIDGWNPRWVHPTKAGWKVYWRKR